MFTGIIRGMHSVHEVNPTPGGLRFSLNLDDVSSLGLQQGASIAIDGVCLTVVDFTKKLVWFDVIRETLTRTTLKFLQNEALVNVERSAKIGDEIGGHLLSGHIFGTATIHSIDRSNNNHVVSLKCPSAWTKYLLPKGYVALNGASLTIVDVDQSEGVFTVHLIPETLQRTTFGIKKAGDLVNVELDSQTQAIVDTIERIYASKSTS